MDEVTRSTEQHQANGNPSQVSTPKQQQQHPVTDTDTYADNAEKQSGGFWKRHWHDWRKAALHDKLNTMFTLVIAISTTVYVFVANHQLATMQDQLGEMKRQFPELQKSSQAAQDSAALTRHAVVGAEAAMLNGEARYETTQDQPLPFFSIYVENQGKSIATHLHGTFVVSRNTWPALKKIDSHTVEVDAPQVQAGQFKGTSQIFQVPGFSLDAVLKRRETVRVEGAYTYNNGFDDIIRGSLCFQMQVVFNPTICSYQAAFFMGCDVIPFENARAERLEQECKKQQTANQH